VSWFGASLTSCVHASSLFGRLISQVKA
jgi:hypothetical protein